MIGLRVPFRLAANRVTDDPGYKRLLLEGR